MRITNIDETQSIFRDKKIIIWGAGVTGKIIFDLLQQFNIPTHAFFDLNSELWGHKCEEKEIISLHQLKEIAQKEEYLVVTAVGFSLEASGFKGESEIVSHLLSLEINNYITGTETYCMLNLTKLINVISKDLSVIADGENNLNYAEKFDNKLMQGLLVDFVGGLNKQSNEVLVVMPPKTGDYTLNTTFEKYGVKHFNLFHRTNIFTEYIKKETYLSYSKKIKIITSVREPIGQNLSIAYQMMSDAGFTMNNFTNLIGALTEKYTLKELELIRTIFFENGGNAQVFFNRLVSNCSKSRDYLTCEVLIQNFIKSFNDNIIDLMKYSFDKEKGYAIINEGDIEVFVYQLEKLNNIIPELSDWLGSEFIALEIDNVGENKWNGQLYKQAQKEIRFSQEYFNKCFDEEYVKHFYSDSDIEKFKNKWKGNIE